MPSRHSLCMHAMPAPTTNAGRLCLRCCMRVSPCRTLAQGLRQPWCAELMTGGSLADAFKRQRAFGTRRSLEIAADCARGMAYLHNKKPSAIVHRDLKPGNLMIAGSHYYRQCAPTP